MSQTSAILKYMIHHNEITPIDALNACGCMRLGARIWDLRHTFNMDIKSRTATVNTRNGKADVAAYSLRNKDAAKELLKKLEKA